MRRLGRAVETWLDDRTGHRAAIRRVTHEHLPAGTGWWFTLGAVLLFALVVEAATGVVLALYYAPTPDHAWDSLHYVMTDVRFGAFVRALHYWGSTIIISAVALHLVRVVFTAGYRKPREANWIVGLLLLQIVLAFAMTGYLLPWDQRAYWATVVRINIAQLTPVVGSFVATLMRGGPTIGAMTLVRWYAVHALVLPLALVLLVVVHLALRQRHGASGPVRARPGRSEPYFPKQVGRDLLVVAAVAVVLVILARHGMPALEPQADPSSGDYIPRPEWYFAGLFEFVKLFPGRWEAIGAIVIPGLAMTALALMPWIDGGPSRHWHHRRGALAAFSLGLGAVAVLTVLGAMDQVPRAGATWDVRELAGAALIQTGPRCSRCHAPEGIAAPIEVGHISRPPDWLAGHIADPEMIAPGLREAPAGNERDQQAMLAALSKMKASAPPALAPADQQAIVLLNHWCLGCHTIGPVGGKDGPDLTHVGAKVDAAAIAQRVTDPKSVKADAKMPEFATKLTPAEIQQLAAWLAQRR